MDLSKKTTSLFTPDLHEQLVRLADQRGVSLGRLVREACVQQYGIASREDQLEAVRGLAGLSLPVGDAATMGRESVPDPDALLP